jgi:SAM-dependent methyltransferase
MKKPPYDLISEFYLEFVRRALADRSSIFHLALKSILDLLGELQGERVCDLACGEGYLARELASRGALVTGVDISESLLAHARQRSTGFAISYVHDDAQRLEKLDAQIFDAVVCNMALMDIQDIRLTFQAVYRVLRNAGRFVFVVLHPCFETPFQAPDSPIEMDEQGNFVAVRIRRYLEEGFWNSGGDGMRGRVGAYHRTFSTYLNTLLESGFKIARVSEPSFIREGSEKRGIQKDSQIPPVLIVKAVAEKTKSVKLDC